MLSKKGKKKIVYSAPVVILVVVIAFALLHGTISAYEKMKESKRKRALAEAELQDLSNRYDGIKERVSYLETDKGIEEAVRTKYNVAKDGEEVFVIIDNDTKVEQTQDARSLWTIFWSNITGVFK